ncbi:MAG: HNH endonuclease signature motif containing protein [Actinomycetota bacterium]
MRYDAAFEARDKLKQAVASLDPDVLDGRSAEELVEVFSDIEKVAAAGKALAAGRVASSGLWRASGHRSAAHWVAQKTGVAVGSAVGVLQTASALSELPEVDQAVRSGKLSEAQAKEVAAAAAAAPEATGELLELAARESLNGLKSRCASLKAAAVPDEAERYARIHSRRRIRHWSDPDGAFRADIATTPDAGAVLLAALAPLITELEKEATAQGRRESYEALGADALVAMAAHFRDCGKTPERSGPGAMVHVVVDHAALERGYTQTGERCEITGIGPVPVATAQALVTDSLLAVIAAKGTDIREVTSHSATIPTKVRTALQLKGRRCRVPGCGATHGLEIDHDHPRHLGGPTALKNLGWLCPYHHYLKTYRGYGFTGPPGKEVWGRLDHGRDPDTS